MAENGRNEDAERVSSPEQLNDYIRVANPSVWLVLGALVVLCAAAFVWGTHANLDTTVTARGFAQGGTILCYTDADTARNLDEGQVVRIEGQSVQGSILYASREGLTREEALTRLGGTLAYAALLYDANYAVLVEAEGLPDGVYDLALVVNSVHPLAFVLN